MEDLLAPAASQFDTGSQFDATSLEANLQSISAVERTWRAPALPDEVRLDLAMQPGVTPQGLTSFLQQIDSDVAGDSTEVEEEEPTPEPAEPVPPRSGYDLARVVFADIANEPAPTSPDEDAVVKFKERAIAGGYIDAGTPLDDVWSPELNSVRYEMAFDEYDEGLRGNRYGAVDARNFLDVLGDWTQPTSLLAAATELDLWWDFGSVNQEFSSWGDKFRKLQDSDSPWDFGKNLVDALTGPIDDIVMPIVNWGLIASGVGGVYSTARLGTYAARLGRAGNFVEGLYKTSIPGRAALNLGSIAEPSWTATKLLASGSKTAQATGGALARWRSLGGVVQGKRAVQAGMRLGFASQAEDLLPGYQGGLDLAGSPENRTAIGRAAQTVKEVGLSPLFLPVELAVAPYNIFSPGAFIGQQGMIKRTASGLYTVAGTAGGRAALGGAIGAGVGTMAGDDLQDVGVGALVGGAGLAFAPGVGQIGNRAARVLDGTSFAGSKRLANGLHKWVGNPSDFLETMSFKPLADDQKIAGSFDRAYRRVLDEEQLKRYEEGWRLRGSLSGAIGHMEGVDDEAGAAIVTWRMMTAAIDNVASGLASLVKNGSHDSRFHDFRNALVGQLRTFDLDDVTSWRVEDLVRSAVLTKYSGANPQAFNKKVEDLYDRVKDDPAAILELANTHNQNAQRTLAELLSPENLSEDALFSHLGQSEMSFGRWPAFVSADAQITDALHSGLLDQAEFTTWLNASGNPMKFRGNGPKMTTATRLIREGLGDTVLSESVDLAKTASNRNLATLVSEAPSGRVTVARFDTATAQEMTEFSAHLKQLRGVVEGLERASKSGINWRKVEEAAGAPLSTLDENQLKAALRMASGDKSGKFSDTGGKIIAMAQRMGMDPHELIARMDDHVQSIVDDADTWGALGLTATVRGEDGAMIGGLEALKRRIKDLDHKTHYTAAEIDVDGLIKKLSDSGDLEGAQRVRDLADGLAADGYKLVYGKEFIAPHDLLQGFKPFQDISTRHLHAETMGNFFRRRTPPERRLMEERRHRLAIANAIGRATGRDVLADDGKVTEVMTDLRRILDNIQEEASVTTDHLWQENFFKKRVTALDTTFTPLRVEDLVPKKDHVIEGLVSMGYDRPVAEAIWRDAIPKMRSTEFKDVGLYGIEAWLRSQNQGAQFLKFATGGKGKGLISGRNAYSAVGAYTGYDIGSGVGEPGSDENLGARVLGTVAGGLAGYGAARGASKIADKTGLIRRAEMNRHGYMANSLVLARDAVRFSLSPFFDISRYTEGLMLAQTAAPVRGMNGERLALHLNMSPTALRKRYAKTLGEANPAVARAKAHAWFDEERRLFRAAAKGDFDPDVLDSSGKWFTQIGIMGFNPTDWMASAFSELRLVAGLDPETAYKAVREMYTYGTNGRSAAELSVNFILFPFSFQKKAITHLGKWMSTDLGRSILIHDAYKTYEILDEKYNLNEFWRDHVPALEQLQKLNMFAFGLSGGQLGGINRRYVEPFVNMGVNYAQQLFTPVGASIKDAAAAAEFQKTFTRLLPAINDINWMAESVRQQSNVFTSQSRMSIDAEVRAGYDEWNAYREELSAQLERNGSTWADLRNKPYLSEQWGQYEAKRAELARKYPAWFDSRTRTTQNRVALEMEKNDHLARAASGVEMTYEDAAVARMESLLAQVKQEGAYKGMDFGGGDGWEDAPPQVFRFVRQAAIGELQSDPRFQGVWEKFYSKEFGMLESEV